MRFSYPNILVGNISEISIHYYTCIFYPCYVRIVPRERLRSVYVWTNSISSFTAAVFCFLSAASHALIELCDWSRNTLSHDNNCKWFPDERPEEDAKLPPSLPLPVDVNEDLGEKLFKVLKVGIYNYYYFSMYLYFIDIHTSPQVSLGAVLISIWPVFQCVAVVT